MSGLPFDYPGLYELGPRDSASRRMDLASSGALTANTGAGHTYTWTIPVDLLFLVSSAIISAAAAGVTTVNSIGVRITAPGGDNDAFIHLERFPAASLVGNVNRDFSWLPVQAGGRVICEVFFGAANAGNVSNASIHGLVIPRGNVGAIRLSSGVVIS